MNLLEIKELIREGLESAILNNEQVSKSVFFELLSKVEQLEQRLTTQLLFERKENLQARSYVRHEDDIKRDMCMVANYFSLYEHKDLYPDDSQDRAFEIASKVLNVKKSTLRNTRDMFDGHNNSARRGWYQNALPSFMQEIKKHCELMSKEDFLSEVKKILKIQ